MKRSHFFVAMGLGTLACAAAPAVALADWDDRWHRPDVHQLSGVVSRFGGFDMTVRVEGSPLPVRLHQGTIINPTGLTLKPGMRVRVFGFWNDGRFQAERIVLVY
ncbi:MAG: hypothetical protein ACRENA_14795 [Vulcanimicrobiaceae bacterium]